MVRPIDEEGSSLAPIELFSADGTSHLAFKAAKCAAIELDRDLDALLGLDI
jgi:hypothetical protein